MNINISMGNIPQNRLFAGGMLKSTQEKMERKQKCDNMVAFYEDRISMLKDINGIIGYRSKRSRLNKETWEFAHENCGKRWWRIGWIMLVPTILVQIPFYGKSDDVVGNVGLVICIVECVVLLLSIFPTEKALKINFTDEGERR